MEIRKAKPEDLDAIMAVYDIARAFMRQTGNQNQWINGYPSREMLTDDITAGNCYVEAEGGAVHGVFVCIAGPDPTYGYIEGGQWLNDQPYAAVHRVGSDGTVPGFLGRCIEFCKGICPDLRIDTHEDNLVMQHLMKKHGFSRCGRIYIEDGSPRIAYQWAAGEKGE